GNAPTDAIFVFQAARRESLSLLLICQSHLVCDERLELTPVTSYPIAKHTKGGDHEPFPVRHLTRQRVPSRSATISSMEVRSPCWRATMRAISASSSAMSMTSRVSSCWT